MSDQPGTQLRIVRDDDAYQQVPITNLRLRELLQIERDAADLRAALASASQAMETLKAEKANFKDIGQRFERDYRNCFEQSCKNLERAQVAESKLLAASQTIHRLEGQLAECYRLSGADPDGNEDWRLATDAVEEVTRLRNEYDELAARLTQPEQP